MKYGDIITFLLPGSTQRLTCEVNNSFLSSGPIGSDNHVIILKDRLSHTSDSFRQWASIAYGYKADIGNWPEFRWNDYDALKRFLYSICTVHPEVKILLNNKPLFEEGLDGGDEEPLELKVAIDTLTPGDTITFKPNLDSQAYPYIIGTEVKEYLKYWLDPIIAGRSIFQALGLHPEKVAEKIYSEPMIKGAFPAARTLRDLREMIHYLAGKCEILSISTPSGTECFHIKTKKTHEIHRQTQPELRREPTGGKPIQSGRVRSTVESGCLIHNEGISCEKKGIRVPQGNLSFKCL